MKLSALKLKTIQTQAITWLVLAGFVIQLGSGNCGCLEHNGWVELLQGDEHADGHSHDNVKRIPETEVALRDHECSGEFHAVEEHNVSLLSGTRSADSFPADAFEHEHECCPKAVAEAVLAQGIRLPVLNLAVCWIDERSQTAGSQFVCDVSHVNDLSAAFGVGPARLVTQTFLI